MFEYDFIYSLDLDYLGKQNNRQ